MDKGKVAADGTPKEVFSQVELLHGIGLAAPETVELLLGAAIRRAMTFRWMNLDHERMRAGTLRHG